MTSRCRTRHPRGVPTPLIPHCRSPLHAPIARYSVYQSIGASGGHGLNRQQQRLVERSRRRHGRCRAACTSASPKTTEAAHGHGQTPSQDSNAPEQQQYNAPGDLADARTKSALMALWKMFEHHVRKANGAADAAQRQNTDERPRPRQATAQRSTRSTLHAGRADKDGVRQPALASEEEEQQQTHT